MYWNFNAIPGTPATNKGNEDYSVPVFEITPKTQHRGTTFSVENASPSLHLMISGVLHANHCDDPAYILRSECHAFFQSGAGRTEGYVQIEFWTDNTTAVHKFMAFIEGLWIGLCTSALQKDFVNNM